ncbi:MAG TPA: class I SAM-dependent methyltransferase [Candidatus Eisenbacteria bacterium]|nr:class I SAM-dependent methyltransferase [Candidatus Eisenbacteria bacterium]
MDSADDLLRSQLDYYRARANEYDDWFFRRGRYDRGPEHNAAWFREVEIVTGAVDAWPAKGHVLELAAGTGLWTERLAAHSRHVTAVDASPEVLRRNRARLEAAHSVSRVTYLEADLFNWEPEESYDDVFFAFWLSHVPPGRFEAFWQLLRRALKPGGTAFLIDSRYAPTSTARGHRLEGEDATTVIRLLDDGREYRIVKVFYRAEVLNAGLARLGWKPQIHETDTYFVYGDARPGDY